MPKVLDIGRSPFERAIQEGPVEGSPMVSAKEGAENMAKLTQEAVEAALIKSHGNISAAARALSVTRRAIQLRIEKDPVLTQAVIDARESMVDDAEDALHKAIQAGEGWATCFTLKCLGKARGYIERPGDGGEGAGGPMTLTINIVRVEAPAAHPMVQPALPAPVIIEAERSDGESNQDDRRVSEANRLP